MALSSDTSVQFSEHESEELSAYEPVSRLALTALVLGILSGLAVFHLMFCLVSMVGAVWGLLAMRELGRPEAKLSGRSLAVAGLLLSIMFGSWGLAREFSFRSALYTRAEQFSQEWFKLVRGGKHQEAHQLTVSAAQRVPAGQSLEKLYAPSPKTSDEPPDLMEVPLSIQLQNFHAQDAVKRLNGLGSSLQAEFQHVTNFQRMARGDILVELQFRVQGTGPQGSESFPIRLMLERTWGDITAEWRVVEVHEPLGGGA